jgi:NAD(P)-dependent dehydrogenase (short-subunit alcohol dehydrogenase family)
VSDSASVAGSNPQDEVCLVTGAFSDIGIANADLLLKHRAVFLSSTVASFADSAVITANGGLLG